MEIRFKSGFLSIFFACTFKNQSMGWTEEKKTRSLLSSEHMVKIQLKSLPQTPLYTCSRQNNYCVLIFESRPRSLLRT